VSAFLNPPIDAATGLCAVYGWPIRHSASPALQNAGIAALGLNWRYLACAVRPDDLPQAIAGAKAMKFLGLNLTVPHKILALGLVDELHESGRAWGAVNTIRFEGRETHDSSWQPLGFCDPAEMTEIRAVGYNTDADAIIDALREDLGFACPGKRVMLLGAGGAGRMAALRLASAGVQQLFLINRTREKAEQIRHEINRRYQKTEVVLDYPSSVVDLLLNATSLGLKRTDPLPFEEKRFPIAKASAVYDMIYRPPETGLLKLAKAAGCRAANGLSMLLYQGARALEIWSGKPAPIAVMREALEKEIGRTAGR